MECLLTTFLLFFGNYGAKIRNISIFILVVYIAFYNVFAFVSIKLNHLHKYIHYSLLFTTLCTHLNHLVLTSAALERTFRTLTCALQSLKMHDLHLI